MIYLDCAATTLPKPPGVLRAVSWAMANCASPGRGEHPASARAARVLYRLRERAAEQFGARGPEQVILTSSATHGLNIAIRSLVKPGDRVVISGYEHNAVTRTLADIPGAEVCVAADGLFDRAGDLAAFDRLTEEGTAAVVCTHVSNVFGYILPVEEIAALCRRKGIPMIVDASQSAGVLPLDLVGWGAAAIVMPGHKGLMGPQGTGLLLWGRKELPQPLFTGGTGSESRLQTMPHFLPDLLEAGTQNVAGAAGLLAGLDLVAQKGERQILSHERALTALLKGELDRLPGVRTIAPGPGERTGVLSFQLEGMDCEEAGERLAKRGIALRAGLHCAPLAHRTAGTLDRGTLRVGVSLFNCRRDVLALTGTLGEIAQK